ncbi:MAG: hypothetical protein F4Z71_13560 [Gammaproteobacteria bacterium]|nr:hypothetical protein [Gammaproteobacteria bacterium]MYE28346.1 hypothetical protein [Gammaproteobacteria bacterium]
MNSFSTRETSVRLRLPAAARVTPNKGKIQPQPGAFDSFAIARFLKYHLAPPNSRKFQGQQRMSAASRTVVFACALSGAAMNLAVAGEAPWRLQEALTPPDGFSVGLVHMSRFELISNNPRAGSSPDDSMIVQRTIFNTRYRRGGVEAQLELYDARQQLADDDAFVTNTAFNALEVLQATLSFDLPNEGSVRFGRLATDWGSRRFLARNRFRNAINAFDGVEWIQPLANGGVMRLFGSQVVRRLPSDRIGLLDNERIMDESSSAQRFHAVNYTLPTASAAFNTDLFWFYLREKDFPGVATGNRRIHTAGLRLRKPATSGEIDFEIESMMQFGDSGIEIVGQSRPNLDHRAHFHYAAVGYSFPNSLRAVLEFDYASGDAVSHDLENGRFDSLFGVTTFEFGVVGMYQPFSRSNLVTPGIRLFANPRPDLNVMVSYRHFWLAETYDIWGRTKRRYMGQVNVPDEDNYLGQHLEYRIRWDVIPGNLQLDTGAIFLKANGLFEENTRYGFIGAVFTF